MAALVLFGIISSILQGLLGEDRPSGVEDDVVARVMCGRFVKDALKAPSTADLSGQDETSVVYSGAGKHVVRGWVDAENSFSAKIRSHYSCEVVNEGRGNWGLLEPIALR